MPSKRSDLDPQAEARYERLLLWSNSNLPAGSGMVAAGRLGRPELDPVMEGLGDRSKDRISWTPLVDRKVSTKDEKDASKVLNPNVGRGIVRSREDYVGSYYGHHGIIRPEYDLLEPFTLVDVEGYLKQAVNRRISLIMRNGFKIVSDDERYSKYIKDRLDTMEMVTRRPTANFLADIYRNMCLCSNVFLGKIRNEEASGVKKKGGRNSKIPIAGYYIIPPNQMFPYLRKGEIQFWRRYYESGMPYEDYQLDDIHHLKWDVKPGHIFGTPRTIAVRDDIFALRRLEENIELLFINHLFPFYHVKVGDKDARCTYLEGGVSEIDLIRTALETMPKEGMFVSDERVEVKSVGAEGKSLDPEKILKHMKSRVYTGIGVSPVDMGEGDEVNKNSADNISQVLKDSLKADIDYLAHQLRLTVFLELFQEANISLSIPGAVCSTFLEFHEIDMDTRIKEENHATDQFNNNAITHDELRGKLRRKPLETGQKKGLHHEAMSKDLMTHQSKLNQAEHDNQTENEKALSKSRVAEMEAQGVLEKTKASAHTVKTNNTVRSLAAKAKHMPAIAKASANKGKKSISNKNRPTNQHGKKSSPGKKSDSLSKRVYDKLLEAHSIWDKKDPKEWSRLACEAILSSVSDGEQTFYTNHPRQGIEDLERIAAQTTDPEMLALIVESAFTEETDAAEYNDLPDGSDVHQSASEPGDPES